MTNQPAPHWHVPPWLRRLKHRLRPVVLLALAERLLHQLGLLAIALVLLPVKFGHWALPRLQHIKYRQLLRRLSQPRALLPALQAAAYDFRLSLKYLLKHPQATPQYLAYLARRTTPATRVGLGLAAIGLIIGLFLPTLVTKYSPFAPEPTLKFKRSWLSSYAVEATSPRGDLTTKLGTTRDGLKLQVTRPGVRLDFQMPVPNLDLSVDKGNAKYQNANNAIEVDYQLVDNGIKESLILHADPMTNQFTSTFDTAGLIPYLTTEQQLVFYDEAGNYQFHFETPFAFDAAGNTTYGVKYHVEPIENTKQQPDSLVSPLGTTPENKSSSDTALGQMTKTLLGSTQPAVTTVQTSTYRLTLTVDPTWLNQPNRVYPITIDPTIIHDTSAEFASGQFNRVKDVGSGSSPQLETYYQELPADENTILLLHMNEGTVNTCAGGVNDVCDASGNNLNGAFNNQAAFSTSGLLGGYGVELDGTDDYIEVADSNLLSQWQNGWSMEMWIRPDTINGSNLNWLIAKGNTSNWEYSLWLGTTGNVGCTTYTAAGSGIFNFSSTVTVPTGVWSHIGCSLDTVSGQGVIYLNGVEIARGSGTGTMTNGTAVLQIGRRPDNNGSEFDGIIDEVRLSNRVRSAEEIRLAASRRPYSVYTSDVIDLGGPVTSYDDFLWDERGVATGDGETASSSASLVAQWNFNETSGTTAAVATGSCGATCNGTLTNFASTGSQDAAARTGWTAANKRWGAGALMFDGTNDYVTCTDANCGGTSNLDIGTSNWTVAGWVKTNSSARQIVAVKGSSTGQYSYSLETGGNSDGKPNFFLFNTADNAYMRADAKTVVSDGRWHYLVGTYDGTTIKLYVDGILESSSTTKTGTQVTNSTGDFFIGNRSTTLYFNGVIDVVSVYRRALPHHEILSNYNQGTIEFQTRSSADGSTWEAWAPTTGESAVENFDTALTETNTPTESWRKYNNAILAASDTTGTDGRIPLGTNGTGDDLRVQDPNVILDGGTYKMWYVGNDGANFRFYHATSSDGLTWTKYNNAIPAASDTTSTDGRIPLGTAGTGDELDVTDGTVIKDGSTYKMWYTGRAVGGTYRIYYATSPDGLTWTKYNNAIPAASDTTSTDGRIPLGTNGTGDDVSVLTPHVIKDGGTYKMWYGANDGAAYRIYYATSPDGLTWTKYNNAVPGASNTTSTDGRIPLGTAGTGDVNGTINPVVHIYNNTYRMYYAGFSAAFVFQTYTAISTDGLTWRKMNNTSPSASNSDSTNGRIPVGTSGTGDSVATFPGSVTTTDDTITTWYYGINGTDYRNFRADMATMTPVQSSSDTTIKQEGTGSNKLQTGRLKVDAHTVALWHFDETNGDNAGVDIFDATSNNLDAEINGTNLATGVVDGVVGKARNFNGTDDYATMSVPSALNFTTGPFTIESWVKLDSNSTSNTILTCSDGTGGWTFFTLDSGTGGVLRLITRGTTDNFTDSSTAVPINQWVHVAASFSGTNGTRKIYINGQLSGTEAYTGSMTTAAGGTCNFGRSAVLNSNYMDGTIDEVKVSNVVRTDDQIAEAYRMGRDHYLTKTLSSTDLSGKTHLPVYVAADRPGTYLETTIGESAYANYQPDANTVALWHLSEKNGAGAYLLDSSGNSRHGTPTNTVPTDGALGTGRFFDGTGDFVTATSPTVYNTSRTVDFWFYPTTTGAQRGIVSVGNTNVSSSPMWLITQRATNVLSVYHGGNYRDGTTILQANQWYHGAYTFDSATNSVKLYLNGQLELSTTVADSNVENTNLYIGSGFNAQFAGSIDEVRVSNAARTDADIRQAYEVGKRSHEVTIDFAAGLIDDGVICNADPSNTFIIDATAYGLSQKASNLYVGDKLIIREVVDDVEYISQGDVTAVNASTGSITVNWDGGAVSAPSGCYGNHASIFKWQREYIDLTGLTDDQINAITNLTFRVTNGHEGRTIWLDDMKSTGGYLSNPLTNTVTSTPNRYFQYRAIISSSDPAVSPWLEDVTIDYETNVAPSEPTALLTEGATNPTDVIDLTPEFSAIYNDANVTDTAGYYQIQVNTHPNFDGTVMWDSGQTSMTSTAQGARSPDISYAGTALNLNGSTYYWRIKFWDAANVESDWSTESATFTMANIAVPGTCTLVRAADNSNITINWTDTNTLETGYEIQKSTNGGGFSTLTTTAADVITHDDSAISAGNTYQYRIRATHGVQNSAFCTTATLSPDVGNFNFEGINLEGLNID